MTARHKYRNDLGTMEDVPTVLRWAYVLSEKANEGEAGTYEIAVDDPDMTLNFVGHRRWIVYEDESDDDNQVVCDGITQGVRIAHTGGEVTNPDGRVWIVEVADLNALWQYRVMTGSDSQFAEQTDVARILQIANSEEMGYFDDLSFVPATNTVTMDEMNGRGQFTGQIADAAAQATGKNYWIGSVGNETDGTDIFLWYDRDASTAYESPLSLSNDPLDLNMAAVDAGTAITYPLGKDTELRRDYARQYSGAYGEFQDGAKYIPDTENPYDPGITLSGRDIAYPAPEIKTRSRMKSRLLRVLRDHATPDEVIKTTITLSANKVTQLKRGMRVAFKATHEPGYETFNYLRVLSAQPKPIGRKYEVAIELQGPGAVGSLSCSPALSSSEDHVSTGSDTSPSDTITPTSDGTILAFLMGMNSNTPQALNMTAITGYTGLFNGPDIHKSTYRIASATASAGVGSTAAATFTGGFGGLDCWIATQIAFPATLTLVQSKSGTTTADAQGETFDAPPTPGNMIVMFCHDETAGGVTPDGTGWTKIGTTTTTVTPGGDAGESVTTEVYARCVQSGDGSLYGFTGGGTHNSTSMWLAEFALS